MATQPLALAYLLPEGAAVGAQLRACRAEAKRRGWRLETLDAGVELAEAVRRLDRGDAAALIVHRLQQLTPALAAIDLLERAQQRGWLLVTADRQLDSSTAGQRLILQAVVILADYDRAMGLQL